ncbi:MAG: glycoside hydrolase family 92 protein, partial [Bacteroidota bacterium]|nr:glycoside hydrolase family 92 protein [Bacteroidota bacterium]
MFFFIACNKHSNEDILNFVDPFIGTGFHGHTFPGPTLPFGMVQVGPDTRIEGWDGCSGYHYSDTIIYGFSHTHLSGTGIGDY